MRETLLEQLSAIYDENGWFVCFNTSVEGLTEYEAHAKLDEGQGNTITQIINHLYFYNDRYLSRFLGEEVKELPCQYDTFQNHNDMNWLETIQEMQAVFALFRKTIEHSSEEKLGKWADTLLTICAHNAYHIGQIVHIRKQFGSWSLSPLVKG